MAMKCELKQVQAASQWTSCAAVRCPAQILVVDAVNGPANVLVDTVSLLMDREVCVMLVDEPFDAVRALEYYHFDLVVVGVEDKQPIQLAVLPQLHALGTDTPFLVVGRDLPRIYRQYARNYGVREVLNVPERATDLKTLVARMTEHYLATA
jgi:DNA-binding NtrC family response regulator